MKDIKISIITATYNRSRCILRCVKSVRNMCPVFGNISYEHIIVDDGSTDNTWQVLKHYEQSNGESFKYYKTAKNLGVMSARQLGIDNAEGDYILFLDSDDELYSNAFILIRNALKMTKKKYLSYVFQTINAKTGEIMTKMKHTYTNTMFSDILSGKAVSGEGCMMFHKSIFKKIKFDRGTMAFEMLFLHEVARLNSQVNIPVSIRKYHDSKDSLSLDLLDPKHALKRAEDYDLYIKEFYGDYMVYGLKDKMKLLYRNEGLYWAVAGYQKEAYISFQMGGYKKLAFLSWFGSLPFRWGLSFLKYYQKKILARG